MGAYKYIREAWKKPKETTAVQEYLFQFRREGATVRILRPTRLDRARSLGYKAKQGVFVVRQRVTRGGHRRPDIKGGRRPKANSQKKVVNKSYQQIAEERVARQYTNCEVLNSYLVVEDGQHKWFEVIMVDRTSKPVLRDENLNWISLQKGRVFRGMTSAGKKSRGLRNKGVGAEKVRPTQKANKNRLH
ncbi:50S ribosomal protein L15e [Candidatus Woesearchaeota archaeon]|nr:50S ribosomal protein L15e [Candidatus Woesearchaeota archaeon]